MSFETRLSKFLAEGKKIKDRRPAEPHVVTVAPAMVTVEPAPISELPPSLVKSLDSLVEYLARKETQPINLPAPRPAIEVKPSTVDAVVDTEPIAKALAPVVAEFKKIKQHAPQINFDVDKLASTLATAIVSALAPLLERLAERRKIRRTIERDDDGNMVAMTEEEV